MGIRPSDAERDSAARTLRGHYAAGRLEIDALEHRLDLVYRDQLRRALAGLPRPSSFPRWLRMLHRVAVTAHATLFLAFNLAVIGLWAVAGGGFFWPALTLIPGAALLGWHAFGVPAIARAIWLKPHDQRSITRGR